MEDAGWSISVSAVSGRLKLARKWKKPRSAILFVPATSFPADDSMKSDVTRNYLSIMESRESLAEPGPFHRDGRLSRPSPFSSRTMSWAKNVRRDLSAQSSREICNWRGTPQLTHPQDRCVSIFSLLRVPLSTTWTIGFTGWLFYPPPPPHFLLCKWLYCVTDPLAIRKCLISFA